MRIVSRRRLPRVLPMAENGRPSGTLGGACEKSELSEESSLRRKGGLLLLQARVVGSDALSKFSLQS